MAAVPTGVAVRTCSSVRRELMLYVTPHGEHRIPGTMIAPVAAYAISERG